ncbi:hypothetical protein PBY51_001568 [Eleginops maclovinus]|uniref:Uncharacterized protein n=1 Tax=Eleginops maclovinus TaxID=56733 RepID=A0AAN7WXS5_ELEMC|nr:hypothetical protein PBY51_001568 [Eleginops maclovinus]
MAETTAKWENDYTGRKKRPESIRKWLLFNCARGAGQLPGVVAKVTGGYASWCNGHQLVEGGQRMAVGMLDRRRVQKAGEFKCKQ